MRALIIDLNNFSRYPTMSVGLLVAVLRGRGAEVDVLCPLARGVKGYPRLSRARPWGYYDDKLRYWSAVTPVQTVRRLRRTAARWVHPGSGTDREVIVAYAREFLDQSPDVVLISTYTMYRDICAEICGICADRGIPVLIGGNYFTSPEVVDQWTSIDGVSAVYGGEPESRLWDITAGVVEGRDVSNVSGVSVPGRPPAQPAPPLAELDALPFADYADFPWSSYPNRIVPIMTGRGCGWGACTFCSDVVTSAGRSFRSRSAANVLEEIAYQSERHDTELFVFSDLKLNSDVGVWRSMIEGLPSLVPNARWTASVHVDDHRPDNGLSFEDLNMARKAGLSRITTGLESGSPRALKLMAKGTAMDRTSLFLRDATRAGMSVRLTTIIGYPGEEPADVAQTADFLERHQEYVERVMLNRFSLMLDATVDRRLRKKPQDYPLVRRGTVNCHDAIVEHENGILARKAHRKAVYRLMRIVHAINRSPLRQEAQHFEGVM